MSNRTALSVAVIMVLVVLYGAMRGDRSSGHQDAEAFTPPPSLLQQEMTIAGIEKVQEVGHVRGADDAPVIVIEFSDFGCPYCGMFAIGTYPTLHDEYVATGKVQWRLVPFVMGMFPNGAEAARAAECATEQGEDAFWAMHDLIYERQTGWKSTRTPESLFRRFAAEIGLDETQFASCYQENRSGTRVEASNALAAQAGVRATPTFFVNGRAVQGALPVEQFRMILDASGAR